MGVQRSISGTVRLVDGESFVPDFLLHFVSLCEPNTSRLHVAGVHGQVTMQPLQCDSQLVRLSIMRSERRKALLCIVIQFA